MSGQVSSPIWLYRITHYRNIEHILTNGLFTANSKNADPNYINIGDSSLIQARNIFKVPIEPYGTLADYIPFYLGPHSPMLLRIISGYGGVIKIPQADIIYLISSLDAIEEVGNKYIFYDGHAKNNMSAAYNQKADLDKIDWDAVKLKHWKNTEEDFDRQRRKQAELLIYQHVPVNCLKNIIVYDDAKYKFVQEVLNKLGIIVPVKIHKPFYY